MNSASPNPSVLIVGIGEVGRYLLEFLARDDLRLDIVAADVDAKSVEAKVSNAIFGAAHHNRHPDVRAFEIDLFDIERTADLLTETQPDVVVNCAVLQTWHVIRRLPDEVYRRLSSAGLGAWLPVQLTLAMKLAQALRLSGIRAHYINTSLSDLTNPVLGAMGIPPTIGIGNVALIEPAVRTLVARKLDLPEWHISTGPPTVPAGRYGGDGDHSVCRSIRTRGIAVWCHAGGTSGTRCRPWHAGAMARTHRR